MLITASLCYLWLFIPKDIKGRKSKIWDVRAGGWISKPSIINPIVQKQKTNKKRTNKQTKKQTKETKKKPNEQKTTTCPTNVAHGWCLKGNPGQEVLWPRSGRMFLAKKGKYSLYSEYLWNNAPLWQKATFCSGCIIDKIKAHLHKN